MAWVSPGIHQAEIDLETGEVGEWEVIWEGTGGEVSSAVDADARKSAKE